VATDDQQRRRLHVRECPIRQIGPPAARDGRASGRAAPAISAAAATVLASRAGNVAAAREQSRYHCPTAAKYSGARADNLVGDIGAIFEMLEPSGEDLAVPAVFVGLMCLGIPDHVSPPFSDRTGGVCNGVPPDGAWRCCGLRMRPSSARQRTGGRGAR
jgi:hypothetical protein